VREIGMRRHANLRTKGAARRAPRGDTKLPANPAVRIITS
jgi:hypothetical protein